MAVPTLSMKTAPARFFAAVAVSITLVSAQAEISVTAATDFLSDVDATLAKHDADKNGELTRAEMGDAAWMIFAIDTNRDGKLSRQELRDGMGKFSTQLFPSRKAEPSKQLPPPFEPAVQAVRGPHPLKPADHRIGALISDAELTTLDGKPTRLRSFAGKLGTAVVMIDPNCPISQRYFPVLARLEKTWRDRGVGFLYLAAPRSELLSDLRSLGLSGPIALDSTEVLFHQLDVIRTTDVFLLDAAHTLIYRGAIDDQYGEGYSLEAPLQPYFVQAMEALAGGKRPRIQATLAPGFELERAPLTRVRFHQGRCGHRHLAQPHFPHLPGALRGMPPPGQRRALSPADPGAGREAREDHPARRGRRDHAAVVRPGPARRCPLTVEE